MSFRCDLLLGNECFEIATDEAADVDDYDDAKEKADNEHNDTRLAAFIITPYNLAK